MPSLGRPCTGGRRRRAARQDPAVTDRPRGGRSVFVGDELEEDLLADPGWRRHSNVVPAGWRPVRRQPPLLEPWPMRSPCTAQRRAGCRDAQPGPRAQQPGDPLDGADLLIVRLSAAARLVRAPRSTAASATATSTWSSTACAEQPNSPRSQRFRAHQLVVEGYQDQRAEQPGQQQQVERGDSTAAARRSWRCRGRGMLSRTARSAPGRLARR